MDSDGEYEIIIPEQSMEQDEEFVKVTTFFCYLLIILVILFVCFIIIIINK